MKELIIAGVKVNALTESDLITIDCDTARRLMNQPNDNFRKVSHSEVSKYSKMMKTGRWKFNGDTIGIDDEGKVKDGQHRMFACINTGTPLLIFPVLIDSDTTIDNKKRLEFEDILFSMGYKNSRNLASAVKMLYRYKNNFPNYVNVNHTIDNNTAIDFFNENKDIVDSFNSVTSYYKTSGVSHSMLTFLYHVMKSLDSNMARDFIRIVSLDLSEYDKIRITNLDAMYHYKKIVSSEQKDSLIPVVVRSALLIKVWNHWRNNLICSNLTWKCVGPTPEEFPKIG